MAADMEMVRQPTQVKLCCFAISKSTFYKTDWCDVQEYQEEQQPDESYPQEAEEAAQVDFFQQGSSCSITVTFKSDKINVHPPGDEAKRESVCSEPSQPIPLRSSPWLSSFGCFAPRNNERTLQNFSVEQKPIPLVVTHLRLFRQVFPNFSKHIPNLIFLFYKGCEQIVNFFCSSFSIFPCNFFSFDPSVHRKHLLAHERIGQTTSRCKSKNSAGIIIQVISWTKSSKKLKSSKWYLFSLR